MSVTGKSALIILGGMWHDFEGFTTVHQPLLQGAGWSVNATYDLDALNRLEQDGVDLVISHTCFSKHREGQNDTGPEGMSEEQVLALSNWVKKGGKFLGSHSATVLGYSNPELGQMMGGVFVEHPPQFTFTIYPMYNAHPIIEGVEAFSVRDEYYIERLVTPVDIHMVAFDRGVAHPMAWSKQEGQGKVAHLAMGHSTGVWNLPMYQKLFTNTVRWLTE